MDGKAGKLGQRIEALFPERQIFIRANGRVRLFTLGRQLQMAKALVPLLVALAVPSAIGLKIFDEWTMSRMEESRRVQLASLDAIWEERYRALAVERDELARTLEARQATLVAERRAADSKYREAIDGLAERQRHFEALLELRRSLEAETKRLGVALDSETRRLSAKVARADARQKSAERSARAFEARYRETRERLTRTGVTRLEPRGSLPTGETSSRLVVGDGASGDDRPQQETVTAALTLEGIGTDVLWRDAVADRRRAEAIAQSLRSQVNRLEARLANLRDAQSSLIAQIEGGAEGRINEIEDVIQRTGLSVDRLVGRVRTAAAAGTGIGGPLALVPGVPKGPWERGATPPTHPDLALTLEGGMDRSIARMGARLTRWSALNAVMERLPLAAPLETYRLTSRFGKRRDPFNKRLAFHSGVDLGAPRRSRIRAAAPGTVSYVGWKGAYGRMIEIDHGYGLKTRYGHLYRTRVKKGESVTLGQAIAIIGSSGRSTGRHLHYEVRFDDQPLDPRIFLKAGKHVLKDGQK